MSIWTPDPTRIRTFRQTGLDDMGDVTDPKSVARFNLHTIHEPTPGAHFERIVASWSLISIFARAIGGTGNATLTLKLDHRDTTGFYDWTLRSWSSFGTDGDRPVVLHRIEPLEADFYSLYTFFQGDELVLDWANPDAGNMRWAVEVKLHWNELAGRAGE